MRMLPQVAWPVARQHASEISDAGSDRTSSSSTSPQLLKRNSETRDADAAPPPCDNAHTAASSLLMLFEEEGKPAVVPMPFFQFPRVAPPVFTSAPPLKRPCFSFGKTAPSVLLAWPQRGDASRVTQPINRREDVASPCSPRACQRSPSITSESIEETMSKMVQARLSSGSASGEQLHEPTAWTHAPCAAPPTPLAA